MKNVIRFLLLVTFVGIASSCLAQDQDPPYGFSNWGCYPESCINNTATPISDGSVRTYGWGSCMNHVGIRSTVRVIVG